MAGQELKAGGAAAAEHSDGGRRRGGRQVIPRPPGVQPGGPPPWSGRPAPAVRSLPLPVVVDAVRRHVAAPAGVPPQAMRPAAVLVAIYDGDGETRVVLTRRAAHLRSHRGEVSFPGGRMEPGETPEQAALREASEEVGLDASTAALVGRLSPLATRVSGNWLVPVVAALGGPPALLPRPAEVDRAFDVALVDLVADGTFREERWPGPPAAPGGGPSWQPMWFFELPGDTVWGATARVLVELLTIVLAGS